VGFYKYPIVRSFINCFKFC